MVSTLELFFEGLGRYGMWNVGSRVYGLPQHEHLLVVSREFGYISLTLEPSNK